VRNPTGRRGFGTLRTLESVIIEALFWPKDLRWCFGLIGASRALSRKPGFLAKTPIRSK